VDYFKLRDLYEYRDCYESDIIAHDDILRSLKVPNGLLITMQQISDDIENYDIYDCKIDNDQETEKFINEAYKLHNELREFRIEIHKLNKEKGKGDER